jgi:L-threonylcarbamoyladenylate synthase
VTQILPANDSQAFAHAVQLLRAHRVIAFPTDTVYGIGAHGFSEHAIAQLFAVKNARARQSDSVFYSPMRNTCRSSRAKFLTLHVCSRQNSGLGALTLVVPASARVPKIFDCGRRYGSPVRVPNHRITRALIDALGVPLAATSANISGGRDPAKRGCKYAHNSMDAFR